METPFTLYMNLYNSTLNKYGTVKNKFASINNNGFDKEMFETLLDDLFSSLYDLTMIRQALSKTDIDFTEDELIQLHKYHELRVAINQLGVDYNRHQNASETSIENVEENLSL